MSKSANLKLARMKAGLTGADLARLLEIEPGTWRRIERGERELRMSLAARVAAILECSIDDLLTGGGARQTQGLRLTPIEQAYKVDLPIFGVADLATSRVRFMKTDAFCARPGNVADNDAAYGMHVFDNECAPRFVVGDLIVVDPIRPAREDQWVVLVIKLKPNARKTDPKEVLSEIWQLKSLQDDAVNVTRDGLVKRYDRDEVVSIDLIVGSQIT